MELTFSPLFGCQTCSEFFFSIFPRYIYLKIQQTFYCNLSSLMKGQHNACNTTYVSRRASQGISIISFYLLIRMILCFSNNYSHFQVRKIVSPCKEAHDVVFWKAPLFGRMPYSTCFTSFLYHQPLLTHHEKLCNMFETHSLPQIFMAGNGIEFTSTNFNLVNIYAHLSNKLMA